MGWQLTAITALVVGAGLYAIHRTVIIPMHHALAALVWWVLFESWRVPRERSADPARWLVSLGVPSLKRFMAYTVVRRSSLFDGVKEAWNVTHAESGLVVMSAEAAGVLWWYARWQAHDDRLATFTGVLSLILLVFSLAAFVQHTVECERFRARAAGIKKLLQEVGFIPPSEAEKS